ncbi:MAG: ABC transporter permease [Puniceicoccaceae bacterium]|nr:MAG: ABC transporter permease [Puniceicoccaceae bacterium]
MRSIAAAFGAQARAVFGDKGALLLLVLAPVLYSAFYPLPYLNHVVREVELGVVDLDRSAKSRQLNRWLSAHPNVVTRAYVDSEAAETALRAGELGGYVILPGGLERDLLHGRSATLPVIADASYFLVYRQVLTAVLEAGGTLAAQVQVGRGLAAGQPMESALAARDPHPLVVRPVFNPRESYLPYVVPAVYVLILQQTLLMGLALLAGTARERAAVAGRSPGVAAVVPILLGRTAFLVLLYAFHAVYFWGWSTLIFDLPSGGSLGGLLLILAPFLVASCFLGVALGPLFREREQAFAYLLFTSLPILFLSGFIWPREAMPAWLQMLAAVFPTTPAIEGILALLTMDAPWKSVAPQVRHLWLLAALFALPAFWAQRAEDPAVAR